MNSETQHHLISFSILLSMILAFSLHPAAWSAETQSQATKFVTIPVFYLTDRELTGETYGAHRRYPSHCEHHMYYGKAMVNARNKKKTNVDESLGALGWKNSEQGPLDTATKDRIDPGDPNTSKKEFFQRLRKALDQSGKDQLCIFVHGAADAFEDCLKDAADLAYYLKQPIVLYSWPSDPKRRGYFIDGCNSEWSQAHFNTFCKDLENFHLEHPLQVTVVSHSMGNRLVIRALPVLYGKGMVKDLELVSPDIDADTCRHYVMDYTQVTARIRLYVSRKDKMLPLAQMLAGGYYRLGEAANPVAQTPAVKASLLERIDFTALDTGLTGHSIPFETISNMVQFDKPGDGLQLLPDSNSSDFCKRVVRVK